MTEFRLTQISDTHLAPPPRKPDRQFSPRQRAYRRDAAGSRDQQRRYLVRRADQPQRSRIREGTARRAAGAVPLSARQSRHRRQPDGDRPRAKAAGDRKGSAELSRRDRRRPLALRRGRLVLHRTELADHEHRDSEARPSSSSGCIAELAGANGKPVALFLHKPLYLNDARRSRGIEASAIRYVPQPRRKQARRDVRRASICGWSPRPRPSAARLHLWPYAPRLGALGRLHHSDRMQEVIGVEGSRAGGVSFPARQF